MLTAHAVIPSLIVTGHLPASASRWRIPLSGFAFLVFAAAIVILVLGINKTLDVENFWDRYLI
jgi:multisubunit Na+/H+ antiporter MnhB subunit